MESKNTLSVLAVTHGVVWNVQHFKIPQKRKSPRSHKTTGVFSGAGGRGRTDTVSLPRDFESRTSANSITPACCLQLYYYSGCDKEKQDICR